MSRGPAGRPAVLGFLGKVRRGRRWDRMTLPFVVPAAVRRGRLGFRVNEEMAGEHEFEQGCGPPGNHPMSFTATWGTDDLRAYLNPYRKGYLVADLEGRVSIGGLCRNTPCTGSLEMSYLSGKLIYRFDFNVKGRGYRFFGQKRNIRPWNLHVSHTTLYGDLTEIESGRLISRSVTRFKLRALPGMIRSFRLV